MGGSYYNSPMELVFHTGIIKIGDFGLSKSLPVFTKQAPDLKVSGRREGLMLPLSTQR